MRRLRVALLVVVTAVLAEASARWAPSLPDTDRTFRVATFNIHKGASRRGPYDLERTIEALGRLDADLIGVQEVMRNHAGFNCDDQPALIADGLRRRTGRPWRHVYAKSWITRNRQCMERGRGDGVETEGVAFFTPERIVASSWVRLSEGRVGLEIRVSPIPHVPIIVTHLEAVRQNGAGRARELAVLLAWAEHRRFGLLIGDFNAEPEATELSPVMARYRDGWAVAAARGRAAGVASGSTRPNRVSRIDYVFYAPDIDLTLESVEVVDTSTLGLGEVSDHHPVVATFRRNPPAHANP
ncbi:MAG: hypothetical protein EXQ53_12140 [Acidobacteria bacterium]|nr:hypothetical protein [Acidobacteriota bacterium]